MMGGFINIFWACPKGRAIRCNLFLSRKKAGKKRISTAIPHANSILIKKFCALYVNENLCKSAKSSCQNDTGILFLKNK
ncbi:hypothetical protein B0E44_16865 [Flavobacterium sp. A45]|nr:hypothetical protein B0E44_16865 [Flavobacterium sp. A45]